VPGSFVHLHTHTEFSMLDGAARVDELVAAARDDGQPALGITDHGNLYGVLDFYKACRAQGITPIIGTEAYMAGESRYERPVRRGRVDDTGGDAEGGKLYYHLTVLAESNAGYFNLLKLSSEAFLEGYYYKPRVDWELLERHHEGLIATSGCLGGVVLQSLLADDERGALEKASRLQDIFGRDGFFIELQDHGLEAQRRTNPKLIEIARTLGAPLLATNDSHYTRREDSTAHDALLCVQTGALLADEKRFRLEGTEHYLKSAQEMRHLFRDYEEACNNTLWIAERANVEIEFGRPALPEFPVPESVTGSTYEERASKYLRELTFDGAARRYGVDVPNVVRERLEFELGVIADMGFPAYFLVVWDLIRFARESGIRVGPGRGSAAGSCVAYCLNIVDLDPIHYDLLFERFLNPGRKEMPDIDLDFDERYRSRVIQYAADRYGKDHVAQIVTFSTIKARAAVRDAARVLGYDYGLGDRIAKAMPPLVMGRDTPLAACFERTAEHEDGYAASGELRRMAEEEESVRRVVDVARGLEGLRRQDGIHAAAVVITKDPLVEYVPIQRKPDAQGRIEDAPIVTQYEMHGVEALGLLKIDFLGLRNLSVLERCSDLVEASTGTRPDLDNLPLDDPLTFAMLAKGDSIGVFQLEGGPMRVLIRRLVPTSFDDIAALVALYRPGPMAHNMHTHYADRKNGREPIVYEHPDLEAVLKDTYGLMIYQEDLMRVAQRMAGYSLSEADNLRKACGKKIRDLIAKEKVKFIAGCEATGYDNKLATRLFDLVEPFADYAFNKPHAYGYGLVAYQTAWCKANYPVEYLSALLTSVRDDKDKTAVYLAECRTLDIEVTVPDLNRSMSDFAPSATGERTIVFGLAAVRNVGEGLVERIVAERSANGPFASVYDFVRRVDPIVLNKRTMESLIKGGAFDSFGVPRKGLFLVIEELIARTLERRRENDAGISTLFAAAAEASGDGKGEWEGTEIAIPEQEFSKNERLKFEKEMLGLYVSDHPLLGAAGMLRRHTDHTIAEAKELADVQGHDATVVRVGGVVTDVQRRFSKRGEEWARFMLEDLGGAMEVLCFAKTYAEFGSHLDSDAVVVVTGRLDSREETPKLVVISLSAPKLEAGDEVLRIRLPLGKVTESFVVDLKVVLADHPGSSPVQLLLLGTEERTIQLPDEFSVDVRAVVGVLRTLLGPDAIAA
jgi:DNA polymerase III subunit alpha